MRPNVLFIVSDDHGYADRSAAGIHPDVHTPALDRLAAEGVTCTDAYVTAPICSPSRAAMISGRYQQRWGALWFDSSRFAPDDLPTIAESLAGQGYRTGYFGKVHYGREDVGDRACPPHHGFQTTLYGLAGQSTGRLNYLRHSVAATEEYGPAATRYMAVQPLLSGDEPVEHEGFLTSFLGEQARDFIGAEGAADQPFFCMLAFNAVHNFCWQLPADELARRGLPPYEDWQPGEVAYGEWYDDAIQPNLAHGRDYYLAQLELMDAEIGKVLDLLDETGQADDTIVIYLTDNGGSTCNYGDNTPLRGTKYSLWEGGIRVPMLIRWPRELPAGAATGVPVSSMDVYPTVLAAAGAEPATWQHADGRPQLDALRGAGGGHDTLHWECGFQWAVRDAEWKLSFTDGASQEVQHLVSYEHAPMGSGLWLTRLTDDIGETTNLAEEHPDQVARLTELHDAWRADIGLGAR
ncbi:arylsulfatase A-like enzyme [Propionibacteriaceae bacterium ES.041]|uniref:sulfatase family protein n=1 Tax=Enemella evansiae TaxID=2016499 RepID=UPI000B970ED6|nr:sulfatase-like hydrolase/transferase [Enemella evansiae]OYN95831.1 sulfatase [Enemella evansiae]PFG67965.1 arylsulfatase A-like enzyme [Propionibacteriaceae bacterium ES.041]